MTEKNQGQDPEIENESSDIPGGGSSMENRRRAPMGRVKKVVFGILAGLGLAVFLLYLYLFLTA